VRTRPSPNYIAAFGKQAGRKISDNQLLRVIDVADLLAEQLDVACDWSQHIGRHSLTWPQPRDGHA
jgi:hypothetical protein